MGGWLDLTQQGLSPCKKYRASWRSSAKSYLIAEHKQPSPVPYNFYVFSFHNFIGIIAAMTEKKASKIKP